MARAPRVPQTGASIFDVDEPTRLEPSRVLIVEADGGSRGNPGAAAYGALVRDPDGQVLDSEGHTLGIATNNFAEYSGLIAGLQMAKAIDAAAQIEVRMDSKLVIEQMAGRWKIKHPDLKPLAQQAQALRPAKVRWTWIPREQNKAADALVNQALDGSPKDRSTGV
jgi:ribonuclease H / adenosylcobalamin/alpha-ribazole phosphatase